MNALKKDDQVCLVMVCLLFTAVKLQLTNYDASKELTRSRIIPY